MKDTFISSEGCIGRFVFTIRIVLLALIILGVTKVATDFFSHWHHGNYSSLGVFFGIVIALICLMIGLMQLLKRLRDMDKPAYLTLLMLVPGVNLLMLLYAVLAPSRAK